MPSIVISDTVLDAVGKELKCIVRLGNKDTNKVYSYIEYTYWLGDVYIDHIYTYPEYRRKGYAMRLIEWIYNEYNDADIQWGMTTPEGTHLQRCAFKKMKCSGRKKRG